MLELSSEVARRSDAELGALFRESTTAGPAEAYLATLLSEGSRRTMASALRILASIVAGEGARPERVPWWKLRPGDLSQIRLALQCGCSSPSTVNLRLAALRGVLRECWRAGRMSTDDYRLTAEFPDVRGRRLGRGRHVEPYEIEALFRGCDDSARGRRDGAMLGLLFGLGLRRSELVGLDLADVDLESGRVAVRHGKGNCERAAYLPDSVTPEIASWVRVRGQEPGPLLNPIRTWRTGRDQGRGERIITDCRLSSQTVYDSVRRLFHIAGVNSFSPHDARRTLIANLLDAGVDISTVARVVGHSQVATTSRYDRRGERAVLEASRRVRVPSSRERSA